MPAVERSVRPSGCEVRSFDDGCSLYEGRRARHPPLDRLRLSNQGRRLAPPGGSYLYLRLIAFCIGAINPPPVRPRQAIERLQFLV